MKTTFPRHVIGVTLLSAVCATTAYGQVKILDEKTNTIRDAKPEETREAKQAKAVQDAESHDFTLLGLYSGKKKDWDIGAGFVGDFGRVFYHPKTKPKKVLVLNAIEEVEVVTTATFLSGVIGFTSQGSNDIHTGFGMGLRHVSFEGKLSVLAGGYVQFESGKSSFKWLTGISFKF